MLTIGGPHEGLSDPSPGVVPAAESISETTESESPPRNPG
jgi:hypothetical protein